MISAWEPPVLSPLEERCMSDPYYPHGWDCLWLAHDRNDQVGGFVTGSLGPIPVALLDLNDLKVKDLEKMVLGQPKVSSSRLLVSFYPKPQSFLELAERGIFVYDWTGLGQSSKPYQQVASPTTPILLASLPDRLREIASLAKFATSDFSADTLLKPVEYFPCRGGRD